MVRVRIGGQFVLLSLVRRAVVHAKLLAHLGPLQCSLAPERACFNPILRSLFVCLFVVGLKSKGLAAPIVRI
jgi:hypothetical protein